MRRSDQKPSSNTGRRAIRALPVGLSLALLLIFVGGCSGNGDAGGKASAPPVDRPSQPQGSTPTSRPITDAVGGFIAIADFGGGPGQNDVAGQMLRWKESGHRVDAIITAGDNVYQHGEPANFAAQLDRPYAALNLPMYIALGNHDIDTKGGRPELEHLDMAEPPSRVSFSGIDVFFLNSNSVDDSQANWLRGQLAASQARAKIVSFHHPAFSCGPHKSTKKVDEKWVPILDEAHPDLIINGHDHSYQRFGQGGEVYVVTGGGGRDLTPVDANCKVPLGAELVTNATTYEFVAFELRPDGRWRMSTVDTSGNVIDVVEK